MVNYLLQACQFECLPWADGYIESLSVRVNFRVYEKIFIEN